MEIPVFSVKTFKVLTLSTSQIVTLLSVAIMSIFISAPAESKVHAFFADEHNTTPTTPTGNRIIEIDVENMSLVNTLDVPGILGHHADNGFNSKIYGVPKGSGYVNVIELTKDQNNNTTMNLARKVDLIHKPRSGDAYNDKYKVILMAAANRPMGSFIDVRTDKVVGTIGENVDCTLTDGTKLLSHADANTIAAATKYHCAHDDHGGNQISGHPYWLTPDHAVIVDRSNRQLSTYYVWKEGGQLKSRLVNHLKTRTAIHQIVPRDRSSLPTSEQADFYAVEEGKHADPTDYSGGIAHALIKLKLTTDGLTLERRMNLQRTQVLPKAKADRILNACIANFRSTFNQSQNQPNDVRENAYNALFQREGITRSSDQDKYNDFPVDCFYPGIPGGHNADFAPNNKHIYVGMAGGAMSVIDVNRWKIVNNLDIGLRSGPGHTCFSKKHDVALTTNHAANFTRTIKGINSDRPYTLFRVTLPRTIVRENLISTLQSHTCYVDENEDYYYNFWTDGGVFYKIDLKMAHDSTVNNNTAPVVDTLYTGGIPIQGSYIDLYDIKPDTQTTPFEVNYDTAETNGEKIIIDVLANDTGDNLNIEIVGEPWSGTAKIVNNKIEYTPAGLDGTFDFWYGVSSPGVNWKWGQIKVTVSSTQPPVTVIEAYGDAASSDGSLITLDVLANDIGNGLKITEVNDPVSGIASIVNNKLTYQPDSGFNGVEEFWYKIEDSRGWYTWGQVLVTVNQGGGNAAVIGRSDTVSVASGGTVTIPVLDNDSGSNLTIYAVDDAWAGTVSIQGNQLVYKAPANFSGTVGFWYGVKDDEWNDDWAEVSVIVN